MFHISPAVKEVYPAATFGLMVAHGLRAAAERTRMDDLKRLEIQQIQELHKGYDRKTALQGEALFPYAAYYKKFKKTYPVLLQLESIVLNGKGIPNVSVPVEVMFLAEVKNLLLTAGHDLSKINGNLAMNLAEGSETFQGISGKEQTLSKNDLFLSDQSGILSSVLNGPDFCTRISEETDNALYFVYGVEGIAEEQIRSHLEDIRSYLLAAIPGAHVQAIDVFRGI